jgi:hypothetical protein
MKGYCYEGVNRRYEYLYLARRNLGVEGVLDIMHDVGQDKMLKQIDLSYNINLDEVSDPGNVEYFFKKMKLYLSKNKTLTALDLAGNHLFHYHPHPSNEHVKDYEVCLLMVIIGCCV